MMFTFLHTGDTHIDTLVHGRNPSTEAFNVAGETIRDLPEAMLSHARCLQHLITTAIERGVDAILHCGDAFHDGNPKPEAWALWYKIAEPAVKAGIPFILFEGNHERRHISTTQRTTTQTLGMTLSELPGAHVHYIENEPTLLRLPTGPQIAVMPWLSKALILNREGHTGKIDPLVGDQIVADYGVRQLEAMAAQADPSLPLVFASHVTISDLESRTAAANGRQRGSTGDMDMGAVFNEPILPRPAIEEAGYGYAALSHIHARQQLGDVCFYAGSTDRLTRNDAGQPKSGNLVTMEGNQIASVEHVATPLRDLTCIDLAQPDAHLELDLLTRRSIVFLDLAPGDVTVPATVLRALKESGAQLVEARPHPKPRTRTDRAILSEKATPQDALHAWLTKEHAALGAADVRRVIARAGELLEGLPA
jgi:DNA repair exonuclease SbcCD nuclease subunit